MSPAAVSISPGPVGAFGKIPSSGDFVEAGTVGPEMQALARWMEEAVHALRAIDAAVEPVRFLFTPLAGGRALVGTLGPSTDRVGRTFPLAVACAATVRPDDLSLVPGAFQHFLEGAEGTILGRAPRMSAAELAAAVRRLAPPGPAEVERERGERKEGLARPIGELWRSAYGDASHALRFYGVRTLLLATRQVRAREPVGVRVVVDCPVACAADVRDWLSLVGGCLDWVRAPTIFWRADRTRLMVSAGPAPAGVLGAMGASPIDASWIWPLSTRRDEAVAEAKEALEAPIRRILDDPGAPVSALRDAMRA